ncbi:MAG: alpha-2-macroglobulin family protein, partial [Omnitrophica WOR_2 bacterium]
LPDQKEVKVSIASYDAQVYTGTLTLSDSGSFEGKFLLDAQAALGSYAINVQFPGQEMVIGSVSFSVAEYRKPEFLLSVKASPQDIQAGDNFSATVKADFYSGGAVANADVSWVLNATDYNFNPAGPLGQSGYSFTDFDRDVNYYGPPTEPASKILAQGKGVTNEQGELHINLPADLSGSKSSQQLTLEATVTDVTGNSVSERATITAHLSAYYPGIKPDRYVGKTGEEQSFSVVVVDWKSNPVPNQAVNVDIVERNWYSVQEEDAQGRLRWTTTVEDKPVKTITGVKTDQYGKASVSFTPDKGGIYRARVVVRDGRGNESNASTYLWVSSDEYIPWRQENNRSFQLVADKTAYVPGDTAEILIASPFQGSAYALVTVERGHIATQEVISLTTNSTIYKLPIRPEMAPNTYVSVMVVKGASTVDGKIQPPSYKIGMVELSVATQQKAIKVEITPDRTKASPGEAVTYSIKTTDYQDKPVSAEVSLSLVDLAVLSLTGPNSQPLMDYFYPHRYLSVYTAVPLNWSIEEYNAQLKALVPSGGGMGSGGGKGSGALGVIDVRGNFLDTAYWQARLVTDDNGLAKVTVSLPDNLTTWRMDARAVTLDTRVGQATVDITSTKPLLVRPQAPRFFVAGDRAWLSAAVHNNTDQAFSVDVTLQADGVKLEGQATQTIQLNARSQAVVGWTATVDAKAERVDLIYSAQGGGYSDASRPTLGTLEGQGIPVERYQVSETVATAGSLKNAESRNESIALPAFSDYKLNDANLSIELAPSLAAGMTDGLTYLKNYPYECTEQTVSRFLPNVLTTRALKEAGLSNPSLEANLNEQVSTALQRLYNQQHADGGWGWWEEDKSDVQVTGYVVFGLVQAQNAGYPVTPDVLKRGIQFLKDNLGSLRGVDQQYLLNRQAFVLYVLANAGEPAVSDTVLFYEIRQSLSLYARAYLAQALYTINAADPRLQTLASDLISHAGLSATGAHWNEEQRDFWNWNTDTRSTAIILDALIKIDPKNPINENAVRWLMSNRTDGRWESTQETAWSLMALTDWMVSSGELKADYMYQVALNGQSLGGEKVGPDNLRTTQKLAVDITQLMVDQANRLTIARSEGPGNLYYTARLNVSVPVEQVKALSRGITVSRNYYRMDDLHNPVTTIQQGEILLARLTVVVPHDMHYLVVEDPLPAGMEPVDASLRTSQSYQGNPSLGWTSADESQGWGWWYFNHAELRDDKVVLSVSYLPAGTYEYTYRVRATTPGTYHVIPPTSYEFYFPEVYGRGDGMLFVVTFTSQ